MSAVSVATLPPPPKGVAQHPGQPSRVSANRTLIFPASRTPEAGTRRVEGPWVSGAKFQHSWDQLARISEFRRF